jgi:hypothetical protein
MESDHGGLFGDPHGPHGWVLFCGAIIRFVIERKRRARTSPQQLGWRLRLTAATVGD